MPVTQPGGRKGRRMFSTTLVNAWLVEQSEARHAAGPQTAAVER